MQRAVIGIGNPGAEYGNTYHNVGAAFVSWLAGEEAQWANRTHVRYAKVGDVVYGLTTGYMNESGRGVRELLDYLKLEPENVIVAHDDTDQQIRSVLLKQGGGSGGHNGIEDIIGALGTDQFWRMKIGARPERFAGAPHIKSGSFVLSRWTEEEKETFYGVVFPSGAKLASKLIENVMPSGPDRTSVTGSSTRASVGSPSSERLNESS
jgi:peptidyl-tRNA hydrolase, PTH1 family